ncbi:MAG TPA: hypothetical protein VGE98_09190 [Thermoanaerobaculia bacterium]
MTRRLPLVLFALFLALGCHGNGRSPSETGGDVISLLDLQPSASTVLPRGAVVHFTARLRCVLAQGDGGHVTANAFSPENGPVVLSPIFPSVPLTGGGGDATLAFDLTVPAQQGGTVLVTFGLFRQGQTDTSTTYTVLYQVP